jgi:glycosyltransferase involved in cell wall biosynthesis
MSIKLSVYIIAYNEIEKIEAAIKSVQWADEVILVDSYSTDGTSELAKALGASVTNMEFKGYGALRNSAIEACRGEWIFSLDADERCTELVKVEILQKINQSNGPEIYFVPRRNYFMGRWIRHSGWYPNYRQPQLFKKGAMTYDTLPVHEGFISRSDKPVGYLSNSIWQYPFKDIGELLRKADKYSTLGAQKLLGRNVGFWSALIHGCWSFLKHYIFKCGFLDGWPGFVIAVGNFEGTFYRYLKAIELAKNDAWRTPPVE